VEDDVIHANVHLVQKPIVYKVAPFRFLVEQTTLYEEAFQSCAGQRGICNGRRIMGVEVGGIEFQLADGIPIPPPEIVLGKIRTDYWRKGSRRTQNMYHQVASSVPDTAISRW
jgi:hypothetical protein